MPSTYTVNLGIEKPATGEQSGTWGDTTNVNFDILDQAINGAVRVTLTSAGSSGSPNALQITNGATSDGRNKWVEFYSSGDLGGSAYVQLDPNDAEKIVFVRNSLASSRSVILFQGTYNSARDLEIPAGVDMVVKFDGGGASAATVTDVYTKLRVTELTTPTLTATTADINGGTLDNSVIGGTTAAAITGTTIVANTSLNIAGDGATVTGIKDEDNMASNSATKLATQQSIKAYVDSQVGTVDTLAEILANGNTSGSNNLIIDNGQALTSNTINETTAGSGVTIDSVLLKDDVVNATDVETGSISANDGTAAATIANSTGNFTITNFISNSVDIGGGAIDGTVIGGASAAAGSFTTGSFTGAITGTTAVLTTADNSTQLTLISTDADATNGPILDLKRDSSSPADNDVLGLVRFLGENDAGGALTYARMFATIRDASNGTEDGMLSFNTVSGGANRARLELDTTESVFNEGGADLDFRVESDSNSHMLFVDAGNDRIGINNSSPSGLFELQETSSTTFDATDTGGQVANGATLSVQNLSDDTNSFSQILLRTRSASKSVSRIASLVNGTGTDLVFVNEPQGSAPAERLRITKDGKYGFGVSDPAATLTVAGTPDADYGVANFSGGNGNETFLTLSRDGSQAGGFKVLRGTTSDLRLYVQSDEASVLNYNGGNTGDSFNIVQGAGTGALVATFDSGNNIIFNENSGDQDFRVESNGNANALFVDAGNDAIGMGATSSPVNAAATEGLFYSIGGSLTVASNTETLQINRNGTGGNNRTNIGLYNNGTKRGEIGTYGSADGMYFYAGSTIDALRLTTGEAVFNEGSADIDFRVESDSYSHMLFVNAGTNVITVGGSDVGTHSGMFNVAGDLSVITGSGNPKLTIKTGGTGNNPGIDYRAGDNLVFDNMLVASASTDYWRVGHGASGSVTTEVLAVTTDSHVGVNLTTPQSSLHINDNGGPEATGSMTSGLIVSNGTAGTAIQMGTNDASGFGYIKSSYVNSSQTGRALLLYTGTTKAVSLETGETVINDDSLDRDFRVESDGNANMLFVDAGKNRIFVGGNAEPSSTTTNTANVSFYAKDMVVTGTAMWRGFVNGSTNSNNGFIALFDLTHANANNVGCIFDGKVICQSYTGYSMANLSISKAYIADTVAFVVHETQDGFTNISGISLSLVTATIGSTSYLGIQKTGGGTGTSYIDAFMNGSIEIKEATNGNYTVTTTHGTIIT